MANSKLQKIASYQFTPQDDVMEHEPIKQEMQQQRTFNIQMP